MSDKYTKHNPNDNDSSGQNPIWPGEGLRKAGEHDEEKKQGPQGPTTEETDIPEVR